MSGLRDRAILAFLTDSKWALHEPVLRQLLEIVGRHGEGERLSAEEIDRAIGRRADNGEAPKAPRQYRVEGKTAVVPVFGVIAKYASQLNDVSQPVGTSAEQIGQDLQRALDDRKVEGILLDIESPGGTMAGVPELARRIAQAGALKPVAAVADDLAASAGYWLGSQAGAFFAGRAADIGSIGVYQVLRDSSQASQRFGVVYHVVRSGPFKGSGYPGATISAEELDQVQREIASAAAIFSGDVAAGRGLEPAQAEALATGAVWVGQEAVDLGLIDGLATTAEMIEAMNDGHLPQGMKLRTRKVTAPARAAGAQEETTMSNEKPKTETPVGACLEDAIRAQAALDARAAETARVKALSECLGGRTELVTRAIAEGWDAPTAKGHLADALAAELKTAQAEVTALKAAAEGSAKELADLKTLIAQAGIKPVRAAGDDAAGAAGDGGYEARVSELVAAGKTEPRARILASKEYGEAHKAWLKGQQPSKR